MLYYTILYYTGLYHVVYLVQNWGFFFLDRPGAGSLGSPHPSGCKTEDTGQFVSRQTASNDVWEEPAVLPRQA